jgi:PKD repeat protein
MELRGGPLKSRFLVHTGALALSLLVPGAALAQGVAIDHTEVGCIVAGKYPKMNACFAPASLVKKARVYFRPETLSTWYYVEMIADAPCFSGVLLKPSKALIDKKIFYYVDVQGGGTGRTPEYAPVVVASEEQCRSRLPVAPLSATGPAAVYPSFPTGFVGGAGLSTGVVAGGVAAAAVVTGGALLLADDDGTAATTPGTVPATNPPATAPPATVPPETVPPGRPTALVVACQASPRTGEAPLRVDFATFPSGGTGVYEFLWSFGDGASSTNPNPAHTFLTAGVFDSTVRVVSGDETASCSRPITVTTPPAPAPSPSASPSASPSPASFKLRVSLTGSGTGTVTGPGINCPGDCDEFYAPGTVVTLTATPASTPPTVFKQWTGDCTGSGPCVVTMSADKSVAAHFELIRTLTVQAGANSDIAGSVTSNPPGITCTWVPPVPCTDTAPYVNGTTVTLTVTTAGMTINWGGACLGATGAVCNVLMNADKLATVDTLRLFHADEKAAAAPLAWSTQLEVPDGEGQVVMNGRMAAAVRPGLAAMAAEGRKGANRMEAVLVRGAGRPGTWRFDFSGQAAFKPGSLRVVAGTVAVITGDAVVFRLQGKSGERVVFTFEVED